MGAPPSLNRKIWSIAWPAIVSNISLPLLGLVDAALLGHLDSTRYLAAVALGSAVLAFVYWGFSFLRMGTTGLVARALGADDREQVIDLLVQASVIALALSLAVILLHGSIIRAGFAALQPAAALQPTAEEYIRLRILSAPAVLLTYALTGWFIGRQNTRWPMVIAISTNLSNLALDVWFIVGLGLNSAGAALATVASEYLGLGLALAGTWKAAGAQLRQRIRPALEHPAQLLALLRANGYLFLRTLCLLASFAFFTAMGEKLGQAVLSANALMIQLVMFCAFALDGFAYAAEGLAGEARGRGDRSAFAVAVRHCWGLSAGSAVLICALLGALSPWLPGWLTDIDSVRVVIEDQFVWVVLLPVIAAPSYLLDGVFIGTADTRPMLTTMVMSTGLVYLPAWFLTRDAGNDGLWFAFLAFNLARGAFLFVVYRHRLRSWAPATGRG